MDLFLTMSWVDTEDFSHSFSEPLIISEPEKLSKIWLPDLYFQNAIKADTPTVTQPNKALYIARNGTLSYMLRYNNQVILTRIIFCSMA